MHLFAFFCINKDFLNNLPEKGYNFAWILFILLLKSTKFEKNHKNGLHKYSSCDIIGRMIRKSDGIGWILPYEKDFY